MKPGGAHAAADRREALVADRRVELRGGDDGVGHAGEHGLDGAARRDSRCRRRR